eukprot:5705175-Amphidinium_carterae.1
MQTALFVEKSSQSIRPCIFITSSAIESFMSLPPIPPARKGVFDSVARAAPKKHFQPRAQNGHDNNEASLHACLKTHKFERPDS